MNQPFIGIPTEAVHDKDWWPPAHGHRETYIRAIVNAGGIPLLIPLVEQEEVLQSYYERLDGLLLAGGTSAREWDALDPELQQVLTPWALEWPDLSAEQRERLVEGARSWQGMDAIEREQVRERLERWQALSPEQQAQVRERIQRLRRLTPDQRQRLQQARERFGSLPEAQQRALRERWKGMSRAERRAFLAAGSGAEGERGADSRLVREVLGDLDADQRERLRAHLVDLSRVERRAFLRRLISVNREERTRMLEALPAPE